MSELLSNFNFIFWVCIMLICVVPSVAHYWYKIRKAEIEAALKHEMIQRGMSAEEITKVLKANAKSGSEEESEVAQEK